MTLRPSPPTGCTFLSVSVTLHPRVHPSVARRPSQKPLVVLCVLMGALVDAMFEGSKGVCVNMCGFMMFTHGWSFTEKFR